ncbi:hypothetical protein [Streptosporangium amethystogenes]|uniref:hypothetical protein n=1 Tax=Streptosporangium amethystogenes TaxID=2002 RepID=UPI0006901A06|nr:hypothetical protein [Streptosporangium amethystogenes]
MRAYRRAWSAKPGNTVRKAPPITIDILRSLIAHTPDDTPTGIRDRAALVLGFALMGRRSELAALDCEHLTFPRQGLEVFVPVSKTDQDAAGQTVAVPYGSHLSTCPVRSVQAWLAVLCELVQLPHLPRGAQPAACRGVGRQAGKAGALRQIGGVVQRGEDDPVVGHARQRLLR